MVSNKMKMLKKAQIGGLQGFILSIVTVAVVLAVGLIILAELQVAEDSSNYCASNWTYNTSNNICVNAVNDSQTASPGYTATYNSTGNIITKLATVPTWIGIVIIVALAFIVLSFFLGKRQ